MRLLTTRELSQALGVSESSLKRWIDAGTIAATRTEGGHRRVELDEALRFVRQSRATVVRPELLELPAATATAAGRRLVDCLLEGDSAGARAWLVARYLAGANVAELADGPIRDAMHALGELWLHDDAGVFVEHRATDACLQAIAQLRNMLPAAAARAPLALGGSPAGDPYIVAAQLSAMVATESGMRAVNLGPDVPADTLRRAVDELKPRLVWLSATTPIDTARGRGLARALSQLPRSVEIVVGGRSAAELALPARVMRGASMADLAELVKAMVARTTR